MNTMTSCVAKYSAPARTCWVSTASNALTQSNVNIYCQELTPANTCWTKTANIHSIGTYLVSNEFGASKQQRKCKPSATSVEKYSAPARTCCVSTADNTLTRKAYATVAKNSAKYARWVL
jgi:Flp pilus assembly protein TadG